MRERRTTIDAAERRLSALARDWLPGAPGAPVVDAPGSEPDPRDRGRWARPALRSLALLMAVGVALAGYWTWTGLPREVIAAPTVLATGAPIESPMARAEPSTLPSPMPTPSAAPTPPTLPELVVHVTGLVAHPGLVRLPPGSRVADAIDRAGGVTRRRAADSVNLARPVVDGEQIVVGASAAAATAVAGSPARSSASEPSVVDLNRADAAALEALPGIGPVIAARIVAWRDANGMFRSVEELGEVSGIGDAILGQVRSLLRV